MSIEKEEKEGVLIYRLSGTFDMKTSNEFREIFLQDIDTREPKAIVINLAGVMFMDSTAIGVLIVGNRRYGKKNRMRVTALPDRIIELFEVTALNQIFAIDVTEEESLQKIRELK
ncbi:MAG: STAS domain-containing protein [Spirochaetia bacterium]|nr:STAS domain-containing protein [Spirochaetia bacterium]